jgi:hypothetical protein
MQSEGQPFVSLKLKGRLSGRGKTQYLAELVYLT